MARFVSKSSNLLVVLMPGLPAQPLTGTPAKVTVSVRFRDGQAEVPDGEMADKMRQHPGFNCDFIETDTGSITGDPYAFMRSESEPQHVMTEMKYGTPTGRQVSGKPRIPPELARVVEDMATERMKQMLPGAIEEALKTLLRDRPEGSSPKSAARIDPKKAALNKARGEALARGRAIAKAKREAMSAGVTLSVNTLESPTMVEEA